MVTALELHFTKCKTALKDSPTKQTLKSAVNIALKTKSDEQAFKKQLAEQGINVVLRGMIQGVFMVSHLLTTIPKEFGTVHV